MILLDSMVELAESLSDKTDANLNAKIMKVLAAGNINICVYMHLKYIKVHQNSANFCIAKF